MPRENIDLRETKIKTLNIDVCVMQNVFFKVKKKGNNKHLILIRLLRPTFTFLRLLPYDLIKRIRYYFRNFFYIISMYSL